VTALEVQRAQQSLLSAEDALNDAQIALQTDLDNFKVFIGMPVRQGLELTYIDVEVQAIDLGALDAEALALRYRLDLQTARDRIDDARRGVANAANLLGPSVDLSGGASVGNRANEPGRKIDSRTLDYDLGLSVDLPVDRLPERNTYRRALIAFERAQRGAIEVQENVLADVRSAERSIRSALYSVQIQQAGIELARQRLDFANESLLLGRVSNSREVVEAQSSLLNAQDRFDQARADLQIQMLQYLRDTGTLRVDPDAGILGLAMMRLEMDRPAIDAR
jgi:outer membrane protein TolC